MNWALHLKVPNATHKLVLLALANFANEDDEAWPKVSSLAEIASTSTRTVHRALAELERAGLVSRVPGVGPGGRGGWVQANSVYRLHVPDDVSRRKGESVARPQALRVVATDESGVDETPSENRCDTGVIAIEGSGKTPSEDRCDTDVIAMNRCDTGVANRYDTGVAPYKEEPSGYNHQTPQTPQPGVGADEAMVGSGRVGDLLDEPQRPGADGDDVAPESDADAGSAGEGRAVEPASQELPNGPVGASGEDWRLVRSCLPDEMQALDAPSVARVASLLRERVEAGWSHRQLRETLAGNALPPQVRSLSGLVAHRISQIPVDQAPVDRQSVSARLAAQETDQERPSGKPKWVSPRLAALRAGRPEGKRPASWWATHFDDERGVLVLDGTHEPTVGVGKGNTDR